MSEKANTRDRFLKEAQTALKGGHVNRAVASLKSALKMDPQDASLYNNLAVLLYQQDQLEEAARYLGGAVALDPYYYDALFNLMRVSRKLDDTDAVKKQLLRCNEIKPDDDKVKALIEEYGIDLPDQPVSQKHKKRKLAFFCLPGLENFIAEIVQFLSRDYEVQTCYTTDSHTLRSAVEWADIVWLEWANEMAVELTGHPELLQGKRVICRLHSYEAFAGFASKIKWANVDALIFVADHIRDIILRQVPSIPQDVGTVAVIPNGIDLNLFNYRRRESGFNLCYVGHLNYKKGPMLLLHAFHALVSHDKRYRLHIAGEFQDLRYKLYFEQMIETLGLGDNILFSGWVDDVSAWLEDKQYIVSSSVLEGHPVGVMEAMARGIRPLIHHFVGAERLYPTEFIWNTIDDFVALVMDDEYQSLKYRQFIDDYSMDVQHDHIGALVGTLKPAEVNAVQPAARMPETRYWKTGQDRLSRAIGWVYRNRIPGEGISVSSRKRISYPEVTGYYIPTLLQAGEKALALEFARWLVTIQLSDGAMPGPGDQRSYAFDTGQVLRGWVALAPEYPEFLAPLRKSCDWLIQSSTDEGRFPVPSEATWSLGKRGTISEGIHIYILPPLKQAAVLLQDAEIEAFVTRSLAFYKRHIDLTNFKQSNALTHFYAYIQEALFDLGEIDLAKKGMASAAAFQQESGAVPAYHDIQWVCSTGLIQLALVWYKLGDFDRAEKAMTFAESLQNAGGGFFGSYGANAQYFQDAEIGWAVKYYMDAYQYKIARHFDVTANIFEASIADDDGRLKALFKACGDLSGMRVLDAGCGKGRFAKALHQRYADAEITGLDVSEELLKHVPKGIRAVKESILNMPFEDNTFDVVYCIEALEHVVQIDKAVFEMTRVLRPGGRMIVIDKNKEMLGIRKLPDWEKWFGKEELIGLFGEVGVSMDAEYITYGNKTQPDGWFICWSGVKAAASSPAVDERQLHAALTQDNWEAVQEMLSRQSQDQAQTGMLSQTVNWLLASEQERVDSQLLQHVDFTRDSVAVVVKNGLCVGCGACSGVCPHDVIHYEMKGGMRCPVVASSKCQQCGKCLQVCPGLRVLPAQKEWFDTDQYDRDTGYVKSVYEGFSTDANIRKNSASGGVTTALLSWMLSEKKVDYVVCADFADESPLHPAVVILDKVEDVGRAKGSKYLPLPMADALRFIRENDRTFAVVGLPCHIQAFRSAAKQDATVRERISLFAGLFCQNVSSYKGLNLFLARHHIDPEEVASFSFRGNGWPGGMTLELNSGKREFVPLPSYWRSLQYFYPLRCKACPDGLAEHADIALGDAWLPEYGQGNPGMSMVLTRTEQADQLIHELMESGVIEAKSSDLNRLKQSQPWLIAHKKDQIVSRMKLLKRLGYALPGVENIQVGTDGVSSRTETLKFLQKASKMRQAAVGDLSNKTPNTVSKVLMVNQCGMWNLGDEALFQSTYELVQEGFPYAEISTVTHTYDADIQFIDTPLYKHVLFEKRQVDRFLEVKEGLMPLGEDFARDAAVELCFKGDQKRVIKEYLTADFVISRGGDNLTEDYGFPVNVFNAIELALWLGKRTVILGDSIGPFYSQETLDKARSVFIEMSGIIVREKISLNYLIDSMKLPQEKIHFFPDMGFLLSKERTLQLDEVCHEIGFSDEKKYVVFFPSSLIHRWVTFAKTPQERVEAFTDLQARICRYLVEDLRYSVVLIPHVFKDNKSDRLEAERIKARLGDLDDVVLLKKDYHFWDYRAFIEAHCEFVVSGRMHPCISSLSAGKPAVNLYYSHKSEGIIGELFDSKELLVDIRKAELPEDVMNGCKQSIEFIRDNYDALLRKIKETYSALYEKKSDVVRLLQKAATD